MGLARQFSLAVGGPMSLVLREFRAPPPTPTCQRRHVTTLKLWSWNVGGAAWPGGMNSVLLYCKRDAVDVACFQEVRWNINCDYRDLDGWRIIVVAKENVSSKAGMAVVLSPRASASLESYIPFNERLMQIILRTDLGPWTFFNVHMETEPSAEAAKLRRWDVFEAAVRRRPQSMLHLALGDFNIRYHARAAEENFALGNWVVGEGRIFCVEFPLQ